MKKILIFILAAIITIALCSCGESSATQKQAEATTAGTSEPSTAEITSASASATTNTKASLKNAAKPAITTKKKVQQTTTQLLKPAVETDTYVSDFAKKSLEQITKMHKEMYLNNEIEFDGIVNRCKKLVSETENSEDVKIARFFNWLYWPIGSIGGDGKCYLNIFMTDTSKYSYTLLEDKLVKNFIEKYQCDIRVYPQQNEVKIQFAYNYNLCQFYSLIIMDSTSDSTVNTHNYGKYEKIKISDNCYYQIQKYI